MSSPIRELFDLLLDAKPEDRAAILDRETAGQPDLRRRVEAMLAAAESPGDFLASREGEHPGGAGPRPAAASHAHEPAQEPAHESAHLSTLKSAPIEMPGSLIGRYKLLQKIGEGGFGAVFLAEQREPVARKVALKIIKLGMDTRQVIARFEAERQALALMDHPHIARVIDAGATDSGRPYFVMEYVKGDPIIAFADAHKLSLPERLELFTQVCQAVQHAHTKGIIHRDLKPGNILVSMSDGKPFARVIDFGIAKATGAAGGRLTDKTLFTEHHQLIGTPEYMSPEQAEGSPDIDTRTDVYSLGVLLYELLTGATPFDPDRLRSAAFAEMQRIIKEEDPPSPSLRLNRNLQTLASTAAARNAEPSRLGTLVKGELDWIVMKALDKNRSRRYESPNQLAADVGRHLSGEPVIAAPPSFVYRTRKFVRRHRSRVLAAGVVGLAILVGLVFLGIAEQRTAVERRRSATIASMTELFASAAAELTDEDESDYASYYNLVRRLNQGELSQAPAVELALRCGMALMLVSTETADEDSVELILPAAAIAERLYGPGHVPTMQAMTDLADAVFEGGIEYTGVDAIYRTCAEQIRRAHPGSVQLLSALANWCGSRESMADGAPEEDAATQAAFREALELAVKQDVHGDEGELIMSNTSHILEQLELYLLQLLDRQGEFSEVGPLLDALRSPSAGTAKLHWLACSGLHGALKLQSGDCQGAIPYLVRGQQLAGIQESFGRYAIRFCALQALAEAKCGRKEEGQRILAQVKSKVANDAKLKADARLMESIKLAEEATAPNKTP